ncbi:hypothetical protein [Candidatus Avelusimicrobium fimicolum]|uniref:hypothetical protein n=1 Tax=Candidatus Avelusimicrobium fimicolum TaxID=3416216 RepID=UPI003D0F6179
MEKALTDSTLTSVDCVNVDDSHIKFTFNFADGSAIDTPEAYVKPGVDGKDGTDGKDGMDGVGFNTLSEVDIPVTVASVLYTAAHGATVTGQAFFKTTGKTYNVVSKCILPIAGAGAVNIDANATARKIEVSLDGYAGASAGQYPRKTASGLEWVAGTGGGATVETGTFSAPIFQANFGVASTSWEQINGKTVSGRYSYIGDILTITLIPPAFNDSATITANKVFYVSLRPLLDIFNIPLDARNIFTGAQCVVAATPVDAYALTYVEENTMFAIQFQKTIGYGTSTNAFAPTASFSFACPAMCFTINGVSKK